MDLNYVICTETTKNLGSKKRNSISYYESHHIVSPISSPGALVERLKTVETVNHEHTVT